jgi:hypothetical protein
MNRELKHLDFQLIKQPLKEIGDELVNQLEKFGKEQEDKWDGIRVFIIRSIVISGFETYKAVLRLITKKQESKFHVQANILVRTIIDSLFNTVAILENDENIKKFAISGLREEAEKLKYIGVSGEYKGNEDVITKQKEMLDMLAVDLYELDKSWSEDLKRISYWPLPSQMLNKTLLSKPDSRLLLEKLYYQEYKDFSGITHQSWYGLVTGHFSRKEEDEQRIQELISNPAHKGFLFLLMIFSEVIARYDLSLKGETKYLWDILTAYFKDARSYYDIRYHTYF